MPGSPATTVAATSAATVRRGQDERLSAMSQSDLLLQPGDVRQVLAGPRRTPVGQPHLVHQVGPQLARITLALRAGQLIEVREPGLEASLGVLPAGHLDLPVAVAAQGAEAVVADLAERHRLVHPLPALPRALGIVRVDPAARAGRPVGDPAVMLGNLRLPLPERVR